ncbi:dihydroorotase [Corynebacterium atypicum]|uniref:Dihydroorotase n=1 Tax=Corynebacterium atypicum TaxID=191610 RepID=A0ABN4DFG1_9CORY|nr:dihydroorotase [Corynebacterium atypicum]AIG64071.1 dihydroorotase [Corynebacterium atypicum]
MTNGACYPEVGPLAAHPRGSLLIRSVRPYGEGAPVNVLIEDGRIVNMSAPADQTADNVLDAAGGVLLPGLVDMHVHLREPGREDTETIATGARAASRGGFTAVFTMANTTPVTDQPIIAEGVWAKGQKLNLCDVHPVGAITKGLEGASLTEFGMMARSQARVRMFSDDGVCVDNPLIMRRALEYARGCDVLIAQHAEDARLVAGGCAHEGPMAGRLGLPGRPRTAEEAIVIRDALLARDFGNRLHICHVSSAGTVELLRFAHAQKIPVTSEVTPHHLLLTDEPLDRFDGALRVNPPLREASDAEALCQALLDGDIDCVATDHAPHGAEEKCCDFEHALPGMLGLETSLAIIARLFVEPGLADWRFVARVMSERPAEIVRLPGQGRPLAVGEPANLAVIDPDSPWTVQPDQLASKSKNTPFAGMTFNARVTATVLRGKVTHRLGNDS